ncbi:ATP-binding cassette domain-containing protein [Methanosarcina sp. DH2]|jgi:ABC-2 type transport system ATP-binding protein|uniref:ABC transporter ATP-binding protein n=1 Tax=unclassified Methanosarcina TaxID=2644672 RepID=UPI001E53C458|nr:MULTISPECIES: ATP-binding cassette domain-containing protein [unclassified Methanosarcina]MCC4770451.1 ATP-binding cassette domain-containing protein [Methanosarcina sp. DH2]MDY9926054.1 ATP-binding cassette domain-containing protein [Methanosarcina sp.]
MQNILSVQSLTKKFEDFTAVKGISFNVETGSIFAFLGPNGAGKSTTIKMLTTVLKPTSGEIRINGFNALKEQDNARASFGIVFQDHSLDEELTAYENMEYHAVIYKVPRKEREDRIRQALEIVGLWERRKDYVKKYSGGMKRRLEIARSLVHYPKILFLDEPTVGLDPQTRKSIWTHIKNLNEERGMTIFLTTHYMDEAEEIADEIAIIDHGKIIESGTLEKIKENTGTESLEEAFLKLTGRDIRDENGGGGNKRRFMRGMGRRSRN